MPRVLTTDLDDSRLLPMLNSALGEGGPEQGIEMSSVFPLMSKIDMTGGVFEGSLGRSSGLSSGPKVSAELQVLALAAAPSHAGPVGCPSAGTVTRSPHPGSTVVIKAFPLPHQGPGLLEQSLIAYR